MLGRAVTSDQVLTQNVPTVLLHYNTAIFPKTLYHSPLKLHFTEAL